TGRSVVAIRVKAMAQSEPERSHAGGGERRGQGKVSQATGASPAARKRYTVRGFAPRSPQPRIVQHVAGDRGVFGRPKYRIYLASIRGSAGSGATCPDSDFHSGSRRASTPCQHSAGAATSTGASPPGRQVSDSSRSRWGGASQPGVS